MFYSNLSRKQTARFNSKLIIKSLHVDPMGPVAQSIWRLATAWRVRGLNPGGGEIFRTCPDRPWGPPSLLYNGYQVFPVSKQRAGREADPSPRSRVLVKKGQSYTSTLPVGRTVCTEPQCLYKGALYLFYVDPESYYKYVLPNQQLNCRLLSLVADTMQIFKINFE